MIDYELRRKYLNKELDTDIVDDAFQAPATMTLGYSHFDGAYPSDFCDKTCHDRWMASGAGSRVNKLSLISFQQWRSYTNESGNYVAPCLHCERERTINYCKRIETASMQYRDLSQMKYLKTKDVKKIQDRLRKRRQRGGNVNYTTFPLAAGWSILLHDADDIDGKNLPCNRGELYDLVKPWALSTPKGKRAGHGLSTWGQKKSKGKGKKKVKESKGKAWRIFGTGHFNKLLSAIEGENTQLKLNRYSAKVDFDVSWFLEVVESCGIEYKIEGDVPLTTSKPKETCAIRDTHIQGAVKQQEIQPILLPNLGGKGWQVVK